MELEWFVCQGQVWCELFRVDLSHPFLKNAGGVYMIWAGKNDRNILKIGHGDVQKELQKCINDIAITAFSSHGVYVSWADVSMFKRKNVVAYLIQQLKPKFGIDPPKAVVQEVNLPWDELTSGE